MFTTLNGNTSITVRRQSNSAVSDFLFCRETEVMPLSASMAMLSEERESLLKGRHGASGTGWYNPHSYHYCRHAPSSKKAN